MQSVLQGQADLPKTQGRASKNKDNVRKGMRSPRPWSQEGPGPHILTALFGRSAFPPHPQQQRRGWSNPCTGREKAQVRRVRPGGLPALVAPLLLPRASSGHPLLTPGQRRGPHQLPTPGPGGGSHDAQMQTKQQRQDLQDTEPQGHGPEAEVRFIFSSGRTPGRKQRFRDPGFGMIGRGAGEKTRQAGGKTVS